MRQDEVADALDWRDPPAPRESKAQRVMRQLRDRPGKWARIQCNVGLQLLPWWAPITRHPDFQWERVPLTEDRLKGPADIYARYRGGNRKPVPEGTQQ